MTTTPWQVKIWAENNVNLGHDKKSRWHFSACIFQEASTIENGGRIKKEEASTYRRLQLGDLMKDDRAVDGIVGLGQIDCHFSTDETFFGCPWKCFLIAWKVQIAEDAFLFLVNLWRQA